MSDPTPTLAYASAIDELPSDRLLRRIVAFSAINFGGIEIITAPLLWAIVPDWIAGPSRHVTDFGNGIQFALTIAPLLAGLAMLIGGLLLLQRSRAGIMILRIFAVIWMAAVVFDQVILFNFRFGFTGQSFTPLIIGELLFVPMMHFFIPALIFLLTLPPLARRMVGVKTRNVE